MTVCVADFEPEINITDESDNVAPVYKNYILQKKAFKYNVCDLLVI